jgi:hypothetical protein
MLLGEKGFEGVGGMEWTYLGELGQIALKRRQDRGDQDGQVANL